jgi:hypothetical protein
MAGVPHRDYVALLRGATFDAVHHRGTGQIHRLGQRSLLHFDDDGFAWIEAFDGGEDGGEAIWVDELLSATLHRAGDGRLVVQGLGSLPRWHDELAVMGCRALVWSARVGDRTFTVETYHSLLPKGVAVVRWALPHVLATLFGDRYTCKWFHHRKDNLQAMVTKTGLTRDHWRISMQSAQKKALTLGRELSSYELSEYDD